MKTRLLISIIAAIIAASILSGSLMINEATCSKPVVDHLQKYSNVFYEGARQSDEIIIATIGLPAGVTEEKLDSCIQQILSEKQGTTIVSDNREDLREVMYASTVCSTFWRTDLFEMWENKTHDYKNDSIYQECREMFDAKNRCLAGNHIWNQNGTCTLTSIYPGGSGMGFKYGKYVSGTLLENEN